MKHSIQITLLALIAAFAFSTTADAQLGLGKLIQKKEKVVDPKTGKTVKLRSDQSFVRNWKTGEMEIVDNPFEKCYTTEEIYKYSKTLTNMTLKKHIVTDIVYDERDKNINRPATNPLKDRKIAAIIFQGAGWAGKMGEDRYIRFYVIYELTNGLTLMTDLRAWMEYLGDGKYSDVYTYQVGRSGSVESGLYEPGLVKDWEHDPNADPLAEFK